MDKKAQAVADSLDLGQIDQEEQDTDPGTLPPAIYYFHPDHLGSSTMITDGSGFAYQLFLNLPFGETMAEQRRSTFNNVYKFNGKELDTETGLYYYGARYYNPRTSVWLSVDPIALWQPVQETEHYVLGQHNGGYFNPKNMSVYGYTYQNPIVYIDPNGKQVHINSKLMYRAAEQIQLGENELSFTNPPFGYRKSNSDLYAISSYKSIWGVVSDFLTGGSEYKNIVVIGGALEELKESVHVGKMYAKLINLAYEDGKFEAGEIVGGKFSMGRLLEGSEEGLHLLDPFSADHLLGSFEMTIRLNLDGSNVTVAVYDSKSIGSATDGVIKRDQNSSSTTNQRYIWNMPLLKLLKTAYKNLNVKDAKK